MGDWDKHVDFLVIGSGAGGMTAAITAHELGMSTLVVEKSKCYGGTTAISGGVLWIPNNHRMSSASLQDSEEEALTYLRQVVSDDVPSERLLAYVRYAPEMLAFLEQHSLVQYDPAPVYPDYYAELEGGKPGARSLDPRPYSIRKLGIDLHQKMRLSGLSTRNSFSMTADEAHVLFSFTWRSNLVIFKRLLLFWLDLPFRIRGLPDNRLTLGKALIGRLRKSLVQKNIPLLLESPAIELVREGDRVTGAVIEQEGKPCRIRAIKGVLVASGGFSKNDEMRKQYHQHDTSKNWSAASPADTGDGIQLGQSVGADIDMMSYAWWSPTLRLPNGAVEAFIVGKSMPGCMLVNKAGKRFLNEAEPYEDFVKHQFHAHEHQAPSIPAYFVFDGRYRHEYPVGTAIPPSKFAPDISFKPFFDSGWIKKADTLEQLAVLCGIDAEGLVESSQRMKKFAAQGRDDDFGKGSTMNDLYYSDHRVKPNPCLAPIEKPPFYAIEIWPGDLGTKGGLKANENGEVIDSQGDVIKGLYVTGNASSSVMGDSYPGAGSTIGPAMAFGYIAAKHAAGALNK